MPLVLPAPMDEWELDFGEIYLGAVEGSLEFFLAVDKGTSRVVYLEGSAGYRAESALEAIMRLFARHGLQKRARFDRDPRLWGSWTRDSYPSPLLRLLHALGVQPIVCLAHRPDKKPMVERCIGTLKYEWLARHSPTTLADGLAVLEPFVTYHNQQRPHQGAACHNRIPDEAFPTLPVLPSLPRRVKPDAWLAAEQGRVYRRRVNASGTIQVVAGTSVLVHLDAQKTAFNITHNGRLLRSMPMKGLHPDELDLLDFIEIHKAEARTIEQFRIANWQQTGDIA
ncbi:MAG: integrase core domain-containing protein [Aggregatilineales bacterium]